MKKIKKMGFKFLYLFLIVLIIIFGSSLVYSNSLNNKHHYSELDLGVLNIDGNISNLKGVLRAENFCINDSDCWNVDFFEGDFWRASGNNIYTLKNIGLVTGGMGDDGIGKNHLSIAARNSTNNIGNKFEGDVFFGGHVYIPTSSQSWDGDMNLGMSNGGYVLDFGKNHNYDYFHLFHLFLKTEDFVDLENRDLDVDIGLVLRRTSGNVGIGKTNPINKLDVKGMVHANESFSFSSSTKLYNLDGNNLEPWMVSWVPLGDYDIERYGKLFSHIYAPRDVSIGIKIFPGRTLDLWGTLTLDPSLSGFKKGGVLMLTSLPGRTNIRERNSVVSIRRTSSNLPRPGVFQIGYKSVNEWIQGNGCPEYSVCTTSQLISLASKSSDGRVKDTLGRDFVGWIFSGRIPVQSSDLINSETAYSDCHGFQLSDSNAFGFIWNGNKVVKKPCNSNYPVLCCK